MRRNASGMTTFTHDNDDEVKVDGGHPAAAVGKLLRILGANINIGNNVEDRARSYRPALL